MPAAAGRNRAAVLAGTIFWTIAGNAAQTVFRRRQSLYKQKAADGGGRAGRRAIRATVWSHSRTSPMCWRAAGRCPHRQRAVAAGGIRIASIDLVRRQVEQGQVSSPGAAQCAGKPICRLTGTVQAQDARLATPWALYQALGGGWWNRVPAFGDRSSMSSFLKSPRLRERERARPQRRLRAAACGARASSR